MSEPLSQEEYIEMQSEIQRRYAVNVSKALGQFLPSRTIVYVATVVHAVALVAVTLACVRYLGWL